MKFRIISRIPFLGSPNLFVQHTRLCTGDGRARVGADQVSTMASNTKALVMGGDDVGAVVVDCGSWSTRMGNAGDDSPRVVFSSAAGVRAGKEPSQSEYVGGSPVTLSPLSYTDIAPTFNLDANGATSSINWDAMRAVWSAGLRELGTEISEAPLLIVEPSRFWPDKERAKALEVAMELGAPAAYIARGAVMTAFAHARTTACVVDVGHQGAAAVPVVEGFVLKKATATSSIGGYVLSDRMAEWADEKLSAGEKKDGDVEMTDSQPNVGDTEKRYTDRIRAPHEVRRVGDKMEDMSQTEKFKKLTMAHRRFHRYRVIHDMKATLLRVEPEVPDAAEEDADGTGILPITAAVREALERPHEYMLPDGQKIEGEQKLAGALFNEPALSMLAYDAISNSDSDSRRDLYGGVILTGGCSLIPGTSERFSRELSINTPQQYKLKVLAASVGLEKTCAPWIGGSIVASLGTFQRSWVSKAEFDEVGAVGSLRRCP